MSSTADHVLQVSGRFRRIREMAHWISFGFFLLCYLVLACKKAAAVPLWMDEVLSVWTARLPSAESVCAAVKKGSGFSPPVYHLGLHYYSKIVGGSNFELRLTSIAAVLLTTALSFVLIRRHLGTIPSLFASCLITLSLSPFGLQVRPYSIVVCCYAAALLLWDDLNRSPALWRELVVGLPLGIAISLHFYAVLLVPAFGIIEILRVIRTREYRIALWVSLVVAGASIFLWFSYLTATYQFNAQDTAGATRGPRPTISALFSMYSYLFQGVANIKRLGDLGLIGCAVISVLVLVIACKLLGAFAGRNVCEEPSSTMRNAKRHQDEFWDLVIGTLSIPLIVFLFSVFVTRTFNLRYVISGAIGASALYAEIFSSFPSFRRILPAVLLVASVLMITFGIPSMHVFDNGPIYNAIPGTFPIVVADASQFFQLEEASPPEFRSRLTYLLVPAGTHVPDPNDMDQARRWKSIQPDFPVKSASEFLSKSKAFYVLDEHTSDDTPVRYLDEKKLIVPLEVIGGATIYGSRTLTLGGSH